MVSVGIAGRIQVDVTGVLFSAREVQKQLAGSGKFDFERPAVLLI